MNVNLLEAPAPIAPALFVAFLVAGTALGFYLVRLALNTGGGGDVATKPDRCCGGGRTTRAREDSAGCVVRRAMASIAQILRRYLDDRFGLKTEHMPGPEIERALTRAGCARATGRLTGHLLERCEPASDERIARMQAQSKRSYGSHARSSNLQRDLFGRSRCAYGSAIELIHAKQVHRKWTENVSRVLTQILQTAMIQHAMHIASDANMSFIRAVVARSFCRYRASQEKERQVMLCPEGSTIEAKPAGVRRVGMDAARRPAVHRFPHALHS